MARPIFTGYAPTEGKVQMQRAAAQFLPWRWFTWRSTVGAQATEQWLKTYYNGLHTHTIDSGRAALQILLETQRLKPGDEVLVQAYTCLVVINAIRWAGGTPVFVDIKPNLTMDPRDAAKKITPRTRVIIIQHTFGIPADTKALLALATKHQLFSIEDCAHALGVYTETKQLLGTLADAAIISFGSDKVVSASRGGAIITRHKAISKAISKRINGLAPMPISYLIPHLLRVIWFYFGKNTYHWGTGKWLMAVMAKLGLSNRIIYPSEKQGTHMQPFPTRWPNALTTLVAPQLNALERIQSKRLAQTKRYTHEITNPEFVIPADIGHVPLLRLPGLVNDPNKWQQAAQTAGIFLGDWYQTVVAPNATPQVSGYEPGSCPRAEQLAAQSINLPTGPWLTATEQGKVIAFINSFQP